MYMVMCYRMEISCDSVVSLTAHTGDVNGVTFSEQYLASCSGDKTVRLWQLDNDFKESPVSPLMAHTYYVNFCTFSPTGHILVSCSTDAKAILWDPQSGNKLASLKHPGGTGIRVAAFSLNSQLLATGSEDGTICLWDVKSKTLLKTFTGHENSVLGVAFTPDSLLLVSGSTNGDLRVWDCKFANTKSLAMTLDGHDLGVNTCAISTVAVYENSYLCYMVATGGFDDCVKLWTLKTHRRYLGARAVLTQLQSERRLNMHGSSRPDLREQEVNLKLRKTLKGHSGAVNAVCFSATGALLASCSGDHTIRLWEPNTGNLLYVFDAHERYVTSCAFSPDGQYLASGSNDRLVRVWKLQMTAAENELCEEAEKASKTCSDKLDDWMTDGASLLEPLGTPQGLAGVLSWTVDQVACFITHQLNLGEYANAVYRHAIDGETFLGMSEEELRSVLLVGTLGHRRKMLKAIEDLRKDAQDRKTSAKDNAMPNEAYCPITQEIMQNPVIASDGFTYERTAIEAWFARGSMLSPMTNQVITDRKLIPNRNLRNIINDLVSNKKKCDK